MNALAKVFCTNLLKDLSLDAFVFFDLKNIQYCTGFDGSDGVYVHALNDEWFLTDSRYQEQASQQVRVPNQICYTSKLDAVVELLKRSGLKNIGFEADIVSVSQLDELTKRAQNFFTWVPVAKDIGAIRSVKSAAEIELLQSVADINAQAFNEIVDLIKPGVSEKEISLQLEFSLRRFGGEARAFDFIVASGPRGALPHGVASNRCLEVDELVTIDFGTRVSGYHSDETVTFGLGDVSVEKRKIFDLVLEAHDLAITYAAPGVVLADLDAIAREHISRAGYGEYFGHGLGHGLGLDIHEYPTVSGRSKDKLKEGMVITIEPGVYLPGRCGVRIEDTIVITAKSNRVLTRIPKQYRALN